MSKEKLLASAQKNLEKGQLAKAISDYQKVVEADPRDVRNRQKLAELFSRARQTEQAMGEYGAVAKYYADNGFYLKAIAVYKQMQRLDSSRPDLYLRLAELNQKQGLAGNAAAEYRNLADLYEAQKKFPEAVGALEKLKELEPDNFNVRIKIIETFLRGGLQERARREFDEVIGLFREKGEFARSLRLYELFVPLHPGDAEMKTGYGEVLVRHGDPERGLQVLLPLAAKDPENLRILHLLAEGYRRKGDFANERSALQRGLGIHSDNLDLREAFIRSLLTAGEFGRATEELERGFDLLQGGRKDAVQEFCRALLKARPDDPRVRRLCSATEGGHSAPPRPPDDRGAISVAAELPPAVESEEAFELDVIPDLEEIERPEPAAPVETDELYAADRGEGDAEEFTLAELSFAETAAPAAARHEAPPPASARSAKEEAAVATAAMEITAAAPLEMELELELDIEMEFDEIQTETASGVTGDDGEDSDLGVLDLAEEVLEEAELAEELLEEAELTEEVTLAVDAPELAEELELDLSLEPGDAPPAESQFIDLRAALAEDDEAEDLAAVAMEEIVSIEPSKAKTGIRTEAVQLEDAESHFQLGIAYKEMGLLEEAEKEFKQAMRDPSRAAACLVLTGICLAARGMKEEAETAFKAGLRHPGLAEDEKLTLHFELGDLYEHWGRLLDALDCFQYVADHDVFLRQVGERIVELRRRLGLDSGDQEGEDAGPKGNRKRVSYI